MSERPREPQPATLAEDSTSEERLLRSVIEGENEPLRGLRVRLEADDGGSWAAQALESLHRSAGFPASVAEVRDWDAARLVAAVERLRCIDGPLRELARYVLLSVALVAGQRAPVCVGREEVDELLELAALLSEPWSEACARAALQIESHVEQAQRARGDQQPLPEPLGVPAPHVPGYRLLEPIGRGGMSVVYRALQRSTGRVVALKLLTGTSAGEVDVQRLNAELRLLARLQYPGIAQILDAGSYRGSFGPAPFLVLEHVPGQTLAEHVAGARLDLRQRLLLFLETCDAVANAHHEQVLHRDLHPENVLVTTPEHGRRVKVVDFALARSLEDGERRITRSGVWFGRPGFMSPEHALGTPELDARADVYSLGAILFDLCAGRPPLIFERLDTAEVVRRVCEEDPARLRSLDATIPADLELVVDKALRRDREERYESVRALAEDVRRFLASEPVEARRHSALYLSRKFVERHRRLVFGTALFIALLAGALTVSLVLLARARRAESEVQARAATYEKAAGITLEFAEATLEAIDAEYERASDNRLLEKRVVDLIAALEALSVEAVGRSEEISELCWGAREVLGDILVVRKEYGAAREIRQGAVSFWESRAGLPALARLSVSLVKLGDTYFAPEECEQQSELYARALEIDIELERASDDPHYLDNLVWSYERHGLQAEKSGDLALAASLFAQAEAGSERLVALDEGRALSHFARARMVALRAENEPRRREELYDTALEGARRAHAIEPDRRAFVELLDRLLGDASVRAQVAGKLDRAARLHDEHLGLMRADWHSLMPSAEVLAKRAASANSRAKAWLLVGQPERSRLLNEWAEFLASQALRLDPEQAKARDVLQKTRGRLGQIDAALEQGRPTGDS